MSAAFEGIKQGLQEAIAHAKCQSPEVRVHHPRAVDVKAVHAKVGMMQEQFAARFGFSSATLRHWERGDRVPRGPARVLEEDGPSAALGWLEDLGNGRVLCAMWRRKACRSRRRALIMCSPGHSD